MAYWSELPYDVIYKIATYLSTTEDFFAFSAVCCLWRSVYLAKEWRPGTQIPVLMFSDNEDSGARHFLSFHRSMVSNSELPEVHGRRCWESSLGWLVTVGNDLQIRLLNPFTRVSFNLPPRSSLENRFGNFLNLYDIIVRACVFRNPHASNATEDLVVMIIYGFMKQFAFCRPGYSSWRCIKAAIHGEFVGAACVKGQIFALSFMGSLVRVNIDTQSVTSISCHDLPREIALPHFTGGSECLSLVESSGDLWMVCKTQPRWRSIGLDLVSFFVYSLDFRKMQWIRLSHLGCRSIFVGDNSCIVVCAANCESNSIYFVAPKREKEWPKRRTCVNAGVYNMESGVSEHLCISPEVQTKFSFPLWVMPSLQ